MLKFKFLFSFVFPILALLSSCKGQTNTYNLTGTIKNAANLQVLLEQAHFDRTNIAIGRATCDANGIFKLDKPEAWQEGLYRMTIGAKKMYFMLDGKEGTIDIKGDLTTIERSQVEITGSETFVCYKNCINEIFSAQGQLTPESAKAVAAKGCSPLMRAFLITQLLGGNAPAFMADFKAAAKELTDTAPDSKYTKDFVKMIEDVEKQSNRQVAEEKIKVGEMAPDISLPDPNGKIRALSNLKGKIVLLDFWASWCGPCRKSNPHVVEMYKKYNAKGFEVFSVSLDRPDGKNAWVAAIKQDGLTWENHVSDLKFWDCVPAGVYGVTGIPKTFLIGRDGKIVAINPRDNLEQELLKVL